MSCVHVMIVPRHTSRGTLGAAKMARIDLPFVFFLFSIHTTPATGNFSNVNFVLLMISFGGTGGTHVMVGQLLPEVAGGGRTGL